MATEVRPGQVVPKPEPRHDSVAPGVAAPPSELDRHLRKLHLTGDKFDRLAIEQSRKSALVNQLLRPGTLDSVPVHERYALAALMVACGLDQRELGAVNWASPTGRWLYRNVLHVWWFHAALFLVSVCYSVAATFEPVIPSQHGAVRHAHVVTVECVAAVLLCAQLGVAMWATSPHMFFKSPPSAVNAAVTALVVVDVGVNVLVPGGPHMLRFSMPLRPLYLLLASPRAVKFLRAFCQTLPSLADLGLILGIALLVFSLIAFSLFGPGEDVYMYPADDTHGSVGFPSLSASFLQLVVLVTASDIPVAFAPALDTSWAYSLFFVPLMVLSSFVALPLIAAVVFAAYKEGHGVSALKSKLHQRVALLAAFALVDVDSLGYLEFTGFQSLLTLVKPDVSIVAAHKLFAQADTDGSNRLEPPEFMKLCDELLVKGLPWAMLTPRGRRHGRTRWAAQLVGLPWFERGVLCLVILYAALTAAGMVLWSAGTVFVVDTVFLVLFTLELAVRGFAMGSVSKLARFDALLVSVGWVGVTLAVLYTALETAVPHITAVRGLRVLRLSRAARVLRLVGVSPRLRAMLQTLAHVWGMLQQVLLAMVAVMFFFAVLGVALFSSPLTYDNTCGNWCPQFTTVATAMLSVLQLTVAGGWGATMRAAMDRSSSYWPAVYFLSLVIALHVLARSLIRAFVMRIYSFAYSTVQADTRPPPAERLALLFPVPPTEWDSPHDRRRRVQQALSLAVEKKFRRYDADFSGTICLRELKWLLEDLGELPETLTEQRLREVMTNINGDPRKTTASYDAFLEWWREFCISAVASKFDDGSGTIPVVAFQDVCRDLGANLSDADRQEALQLLDREDDGRFSLSEFLQFFVGVWDVLHSFRRYSDDEAGGITWTGFQRLTETLGAADLDDATLFGAFMTLDVDRSGVVTFEEFLPWWLSRRDFAAKRKSVLRAQRSSTKASNWEQAFLEDAMKGLGLDGDGATATRRGLRTVSDVDKTPAADLHKLDTMAKAASVKLLAGDSHGAFALLVQLHEGLAAATRGQSASDSSPPPQALPPVQLPRLQHRRQSAPGVSTPTPQTTG